MVEHLHVPSEKILILLLNRTQSLDWRNRTVLNSSGKVWRTSYYGFIQGELNTYYPIALRNCGDILNKRIKPTFLTFECAQFLVSKVIERRREKLGAFAGVTSYSDRISIDLTANLIKAATSDIPSEEIGNRLFNALEFKDEVKKQILKDTDDIVRDYKKKCLELGMFDFGMAVDLYNNCLLKDDKYKEKLIKRVQHLIVDNIEECVPTEVDFVEMLLPNLKTCLLGYNSEGGYCEFFGGNLEYVKQRIVGKCDTIEIGKTFTCADYMYEFSEMLFDNILNRFSSDPMRPKLSSGSLKNITPYIERIPACELRSDMLEMVGEKVCRLISEETYKPSDIVILSTYADPVTEYAIGRILERQGYQIKNLTKRDRIIDNQVSMMLLTLAQLCHPSYGVSPNRDEVKAFLGTIMNIDPVRSSILAGVVCNRKPFAEFPDIELTGLAERVGHYNVEKYEYVRNWINDYKSSEVPLPINEFFHKAFLEILISRKISENDILQVKNLIDSAQTFVDIVSRFNRNTGKDFLDMARSGIKSDESILDLEEKQNANFVLLTTPVSYLAGSLKNKVIILTSISSKNWSPRSIKELTNSHVLTKTWDINSIYTEQMEDENQRHYLALLIRAIIKRCGEKLITFESTLSANGFENDGILVDYFDEILGGT